LAFATSTTLLSEWRSFGWSHLGHNNCLAVLVKEMQSASADGSWGIGYCQWWNHSLDPPWGSHGCWAPLRHRKAYEM
jgi:hypothetical protein